MADQPQETGATGAAGNSISDVTIKDWTPSDLMRYVRDQLTQDPVSVGSGQSVDELTIVRKLTLSDEIQLNGTNQTTVGAAGGASAPPANPAGYIRILDNLGQVRVVPYYNP